MVTKLENNKLSSSRNSTELSKYAWSLKDNNINHVITWKIIARAKPYNSASKRCNLCILEKFIIIREPHHCTLKEMNLFQVVDIGKNHYSAVIEQPLGSLYVNFRDI